jgi:hypothetical protein
MKLESELQELQRLLAQVDHLHKHAHTVSHTDVVELQIIKLGKLKFKMYQESGHRLPHIHIDYGRENHAASYSLDPVARIAGTLDRKYDQKITAWISPRREELLKLWEIVQAGGEPSGLVHELAGDP